MIFSLVVLSLKLSAGRVSPNWVNLRSCKHYFKNEWGSWFFKFEVMALKWYKPNMCLFFRFCLRPTHILKHSDSRRLAASCSHRLVAPGGPWGWPPDFDVSVNPISSRGTDYAHQIILAPSDFQTFQRPCHTYERKQWEPGNTSRPTLSTSLIVEEKSMVIRGRKKSSARKVDTAS